jgi:DamX protein
MQMAVSELNDRLDYLISYSSQLVFVCSDKIQLQSKVVESFIAQQNEHADLALLTANELTPLANYREKLFRQLISQNQEADFNRPLNQLLAKLNEHNGSILISVFQAEKLPNKLVKELWDLVLQSRFANNKQHLNVLLMGLSDWAEMTKSGLGAKFKGQPIVLSSQNDIQHINDNEFSDLESLIQDKRKKFAKRIQDRHYQSAVSYPIYKKWWVATLFGLVFLITFTGILGWQYSEKVSAFISFVNAKIYTQEQSVKPSDVTELEKLPSEIITQPEPQLIRKLNTLTDAPIVKQVSTKDILVTDWNTASAKIKGHSKNVLLQTSNSDKQTTLSLEPGPPIIAEVSEEKTNTVNDYRIEDKVKFDLIAKKTGSQPSNIEQVLTDDFLYPVPDMLLALPSENFLIQIAAMANVNILQDYIRDEQLGQQLWLYKTQRYGEDWYVLLKNQHFPSIGLARAEIINLADSMLRNTPFVKRIAQVKQEISISAP